MKSLKPLLWVVVALLGAVALFYLILLITAWI